MPRWPVTLVDGSLQVADADGTHYPIFMQGAPVRELSAGWSAAGLQTGLGPLHVLELRHESGPEACWLLDTALEVRANAVAHLDEPERRSFLDHLEPLVRNLFDEAVLAPHAAIPAAAHAFDGFGPGPVAALIRLPAANAIGTPDLVSAPALGATGGGYERRGVTLPAGWAEAVLRTADGAGGVPAPGGATLAAQERLALPGHDCHRFHDRATGLVFYLLAGADPADRHLYVPQPNVVFTAAAVATAAAHDPLLLLLVYYATHTDRAVMLPEADGLRPMEAPMAATAAVGPDPVAAVEPPSLPVHETAHEPIRQPAMAAAEAAPQAASPAMDEVMAAPAAEPPVPPPPPRQNWWQRLLGLGQG